MRNLFDLRGTFPPFALLKLTHRFRKLRSGETMEVIGTNPDSKKEILSVLKALPCEVLYVGNTKSCYYIRLRKLAKSKAHGQDEKNYRRHLQINFPGCPDTAEALSDRNFCLKHDFCSGTGKKSPRSGSPDRADISRQGEILRSRM